MSKMIYLDDWAGRVRMARTHRQFFPRMNEIFQTDPTPPENYSAEKIEFALKLVAHWEGGVDPNEPAAVPVKLNETFPDTTPKRAMDEPVNDDEL